MVDALLRLVVRTPHEVIAELAVDSLRVPSDTGQVGLRPGCEPGVLAIEPGLALASTAAGVRFLATAGGALRCDGRTALLLSPIAVVGDDAESVRRRLDEALTGPAADADLRRALGRLETALLRELREGGERRGPKGAEDGW